MARGLWAQYQQHTPPPGKEMRVQGGEEAGCGLRERVVRLGLMKKVTSVQRLEAYGSLEENIPVRGTEVPKPKAGNVPGVCEEAARRPRLGSSGPG